MKSRILYLIAISFFSTLAKAQNGDQPITVELVGKWCYINLELTNDTITGSCVTLNSDGTYEATLDRSTIPNGTSLPNLQDNDTGKWWFKNNRLFYNSTNNGQGSFSLQKANHPRLENTPMIVLNGVAFATASSKDPW
jgi:hypothetical protein